MELTRTLEALRLAAARAAGTVPFLTLDPHHAQAARTVGSTVVGT